MAVTKPAKKNANHPCHLHTLVKSDTQKIYASYNAKWRCDGCQTVYDGHKESFTTGEKEEEEVDHRHTYHCNLCNFDLCVQCFKGRIHHFHPHRLKKARAPLIYEDTSGQWKCDGCSRIFCEANEQICYHCDESCEVDLCERCYKGEWKHILHNEAGHLLKPIDPRLAYRVYSEWVCDHCGATFNHDNTLMLFHCGASNCEFDLCTDCFMGKKHHLHQHHITKVVTKTSRGTTTTKFCTHCRTRISDPHCYSCCDPSCRFVLCQNCYDLEPQPHPLHPTHPLEVCDAAQVYPQSGGMWHCDNCTTHSVYKEPTPLPPAEPMYHCHQCEYDLCEQCYLTGLKKQEAGSDEEAFRPVQVAESEDSASYQPYTLRYFTNEIRPVTSQAPLSFLTTPFVPPHRLCVVCKAYTATMTFTHGGISHSGPALCCQRCAADIVNYQRECPKCGQVPDRAVDALSV